MNKTWPLGDLPKHLQRPEFNQLHELGYTWDDPQDIISMFEQQVSDFAGSKYGIAVDSCSNALFLTLKYLQATGSITIPSHTYISVPMQIKHAGCKVAFEDVEWSGVYQLKPYPIWDGATRWTRGMYQGGYHVVSFQMKKRVPIGKGGMILTDDADAYHWFKRAVHDGRTPGVSHSEDTFSMLGWHFNMTPEDAARGIILMHNVPAVNADSSNNNSYTDLSMLEIFQ